MTRRDFLCMILGAVFVIALQGMSTELQVELGQCHFGLERDGVFWQSDRYTSNYLTPNCGSIGFAGKLSRLLNETNGKWGWRAALFTSGSIRTRDNVATLYDDEAGRHDIQCSGYAGEGRGCLARMEGSGNMKGLSFSITRDFTLGRVTLIPEVGVFHYISKFRNTPHHVDCWDCSRHGEFVAGNRSDFFTALPGVLLGVSARYRSVYVSYRAHYPQGGRGLSLTDNSFSQIAVGYAWNL